MELDANSSNVNPERSTNDFLRYRWNSLKRSKFVDNLGQYQSKFGNAMGVGECQSREGTDRGLSGLSLRNR